MRIRNHVGYWNQQTGSTNRISGKAHWEGTFVGCLVLFSVFVLMLMPFGGRSAAPGLQIGPFTNVGGLTFVTVTITNGSSTNTYQIDRKLDLSSDVPWVGSTTGTLGQTTFLIPLGPEFYMFYRAIDCNDCDFDGIPNSRDANPLNANVGVLSITILSPTNGATIY